MFLKLSTTSYLLYEHFKLLTFLGIWQEHPLPDIKILLYLCFTQYLNLTAKKKKKIIISTNSAGLES